MNICKGNIYMPFIGIFFSIGIYTSNFKYSGTSWKISQLENLICQVSRGGMVFATGERKLLSSMFQWSRNAQFVYIYCLSFSHIV